MPPIRIYPDLATYLRDQGISQAAFAATVGVDAGYVSRVINKKQSIPLRRALEWSRIANVPLESFIVDNAAIGVTEHTS